jgi:membrane protease YdiL (CAAX protease family)
MDVRNDAPHSSRLKSLTTVLLGSAVFIVVVLVINAAVKTLFGVAMASSLRARATIELTGAMVSEVIVLILLLLYFRRRDVRLRQIGLWAPAPARGWIAAAAVATLFIWFNLVLPLRDQPGLAELSLFRVYNSLMAGLTAGFTEEIFFRGFFMTELGRAGFGKTAQVAVSALLYGLVHSAWGITSGMFTLQMVGGAVVGTAIFGACCSVVYLISRRSLMPVIAGHAVTDFVIEPWLFMVAITMSQAR